VTENANSALSAGRIHTRNRLSTPVGVQTRSIGACANRTGSCHAWGLPILGLSMRLKAESQHRHAPGVLANSKRGGRKPRASGHVRTKKNPIEERRWEFPTGKCSKLPGKNVSAASKCRAVSGVTWLKGTLSRMPNFGSSSKRTVVIAHIYRLGTMGAQVKKLYRVSARRGKSISPWGKTYTFSGKSARK